MILNYFIPIKCFDFFNYLLPNYVIYIEYKKERKKKERKKERKNRFIGLVGRLFANDPGDLGSILGRVIPKALKMVLDTSLLNTQQYKVRIKSKVEQSTVSSSALPNTSVQ